MELQHSFTVPASVETTWEAFNDLNRIGGCLPGATITSVDGDDFTGSVKVKLGPISLLYNGTGSYRTRDEATRTVVIDAKGKDKRGNGTASAVITARLTASGDGTSVEVDTDLSITGKPAQFGRGVIQDVSDKLLGQFVECIKGKLTDADASGTAAGGTVGGGAVGGAADAGVASSDPTDQAKASPLDNAPSGGATSKAAAGDPADQAKRNPLGNAPSGGATSKAAAGGADHQATDASLDIASPDGAMSQGTAAGGPGGSGKSGISAGSGVVGVPAGTSPATAVSGPEPELDLFATVGPVLVKRYAAPVLGALVLLLILRKILSGKKDSDD